MTCVELSCESAPRPDSAKNTGTSAPLKVLACAIAKKGQPLTFPVK